jgi:hypothetical protein
MKTLITTLMLAISLTLYSQKDQINQIDIKGITTFTDEMGDYSRLSEVDINIYEYNTILAEYESNYTGRFEFNIPINSYIVIEYNKEDFITKRILFDTRACPEMKKIKPFDLEISMIKRVAGVDYSELDFPITRIEYSKEAKDFVFVEGYTEHMLKKQNKVLAIMAK